MALKDLIVTRSPGRQRKILTPKQRLARNLRAWLEARLETPPSQPLAARYSFSAGEEKGKKTAYRAALRALNRLAK